ncbi:hypothetical protein JQ599_12525 [Bradyrhizobium diazoefficiens]|nr:hypothetical protein [Bradyrhizobium diazoefficiens]MBR0700726.1 hypothetical protein [Bradyrhizobium diazoefficiens]MBR0769151.1 hypothetical protein [Bradyrhizobium diazoefficiens]
MLQALGLDDGHALGVVAPCLLHHLPVELFRASLRQIGPPRIAIERRAPEDAPLAEPARTVDDNENIGACDREIEGQIQLPSTIQSPAMASVTFARKLALSDGFQPGRQ